MNIQCFEVHGISMDFLSTKHLQPPSSAVFTSTSRWVGYLWPLEGLHEQVLPTATSFGNFAVCGMFRSAKCPPAIRALGETKNSWRLISGLHGKKKEH
jgi:hypothetical protein